MKPRRLVVMVALVGSLGAAWACGAATGVGAFDEVRKDGGPDSMGRVVLEAGDARTADTSVDAADDVVVTDAAAEAPSGNEAGDASGADTAPDSPGDVAVADVAADVPSCMGALDSGSLPPSCAPGGPGMANCGPGGSGTESCCSSLEVCGGDYYRTFANSGSGPTGEADVATVSDFRLDKYLVTVGRFRQFVSAWNKGRGYYPAAESGKHTHLNGGQGLANVGIAEGYETGWDATNWNNKTDIDPTNANLSCVAPYYAWTWTNAAGSQENLPINCVNWWEAYAFCIWDGGFLPSEAEWEYAAGGSQQREYPWGSTDPAGNSRYAIYSDDYDNGSIAPVGTATLGAGIWGQLDMAGEVWEWNLDWYATYSDPSINGAWLSPASYRVIRGGDFDNDTPYLLLPYRNDEPPSLRYNTVGFRCARTP